MKDGRELKSKAFAAKIGCVFWHMHYPKFNEAAIMLKSAKYLLLGYPNAMKLYTKTGDDGSTGLFGVL